MHTSSNAPTTTPAPRVGAGFITLYALAYMGLWLALLSPILVTLPLKMTALVGADDAPGALSLVAGVGALLAMFGNPFFGKLSDRTTSRFGMRRPWMVIGLVGGTVGLLLVALAPSVPLVVVGWSVTQLAFNAVLAAVVAVLVDQISERQRGTVSGILGVCPPIALVAGTYVVQLVAPLGQLAMFMFPVAIAGVLILAFAVVLKDRRLSAADRPAAWSLKEFLSTFYVDPRRAPDFTWAWISRFLFVLGQAFLLTYQAFYLLDKIGVTEADLPGEIFVATLTTSVFWVVFSVLGGRLSDATGRRKVFALVSAAIYGLALLLVAVSSEMTLFLVAMGVAGIGIGIYFAIDLALVSDVLPDPQTAAKDLGVFNIASALPQSIAPAIAPAILAIGGGNYSVLYFFAAGCAVLGALAILRVKGVR